MTHHDAGEQEQPTREKPSQAEGGEKRGEDLKRKKPSQAEGSEEEIDEILDEEGLE